MAEYASIAMGIVSTLISGGVGLVVWGFKGELRASLAEAENRFYTKVNGNYVRRELHTDLVARVDRIENKVDELE